MTGIGRWLTIAVVAVGLGTAACGADEDPLDQAAAPIGNGADGTDDGPVRYEAVVIETHPHDPSAYTQGLEFIDGLLLESTGLVDETSIRLVDPETGEITQIREVDTVFGEGTTLVDDEIWQLTWQDETLIVHDAQDLSERRRLTYDGEGWGLCDAGDRLLMTNGSAELFSRDRESFDITDSVTVTLDGDPVEKLNELECVGDRVWANVFQSEQVLEIDPTTGEVVGFAELGSLVPDGFGDSVDLVLNGIAFNEDTERFWLTGKQWPVMYELEFRAVESP